MHKNFFDNKYHHGKTQHPVEHKGTEFSGFGFFSQITNNKKHKNSQTTYTQVSGNTLEQGY